MKLPKSLQPNHLMQKAAPGDVTLGVMRQSLMNSDIVAVIRAQTTLPDRVRIRCLNNDGKELPDDMTVAEFRKLCAAGKARIAIDDGQGGELVS